MKKFLLLMLSFLGLHATQFDLGSSYSLISTWQGGYEVNVVLKNGAPSPTTNWSGTFTLGAGQTISSLWNADYSEKGQVVTFTNPSWNGGGVIPAGGSTSFGMVILNPQNTANTLTGLTAVGNATIVTPVPAAPTLNAIVPSGNNYKVAWNAVANATSYLLQQSTSSSFASPVTVEQGSALSYSVTNQPNGTYYYRVSASDASGVSPFSNVESVSINIAPTLPAPVMNAISNASQSGNYTISWSGSTGATNYTLQVSSTSSFASYQTVATTAATSYAVTNQAAGTYYYRVVAGATGETSNPSNVVSTTVATPTTGQHLDSYWETWNSTDALSTIADMKYDVVCVSFGTFSSTGNNTFTVTGLDCSEATLTQFVTLVHAAGKKVKISIGGAGDPIGNYLTSTASAAGCAQAIANFIAQNNLDGVDLDIEDGTAANLQIALIQNLRALLPNTLISYTPGTPCMNYEPFTTVIKSAYQYVDLISFMAYDYGTQSGYNYTQDVQAMLAYGIPSNKIGIGLMPGLDDLGVLTSLADITTAAEYAVTNKLAGLMFWDLNRDHENETGLGADAATNTAYPILHGTGG